MLRAAGYTEPFQDDYPNTYYVSWLIVETHSQQELQMLCVVRRDENGDPGVVMIAVNDVDQQALHYVNVTISNEYVITESQWLSIQFDESQGDSLENGDEGELLGMVPAPVGTWNAIGAPCLEL